ncbi:MAG: hypothetical protein CSA81_12895 [Acidobacteria bacterium]|nr:MAG: hypothetical protein CSA81_12895 [Acidobacteriota bacterium]PIE89116.1 MAG: hypothetical protein CR997_12635 [Acidobacteriota bacterium]
MNKRRLAYVFIVLLASFTVAFHLKPVQKHFFDALFRVVEEKTGYLVQAESPYLNLFRLSFHALNSTCVGPGVDSSFKEIDVNASLWNWRTFQQIKVIHGSVHLYPDQFPQSETASGELNIPELTIEHLVLTRFNLFIHGEKEFQKTVDFEVRNAAIQLENQHLQAEASLDLPALEALDFQTELAFSLKADISSFPSARNMHITACNDHIWMTVTGDLKADLQPSNLDIGLQTTSLPDPFSQGLNLESRLFSASPSLTLCTAVSFQQSELPVTLIGTPEISFSPSGNQEPALTMLTDWSIGQRVHSSATLRMNSDGMSASGWVEGQVEEQVDGSLCYLFTMPDFEYKEAVLDFGGAVDSLAGLTLIEGSLDRDLHMMLTNPNMGELQIRLPNALEEKHVYFNGETLPISQWPVFPADLFSFDDLTFKPGGFSFSADVTYEDQVMMDFYGVLEPSYLLDSVPLTLAIESSGALSAMTVQVTAVQEREVFSASTRVNFNEQKIERGSFAVSDLNLQYDQTKVSITADGDISGTLNDPLVQLNSTLKVFDGSNQVAFIRSDVKATNQSIAVQGFNIDSALYTLSGEGTYVLTQENVKPVFEVQGLGPGNVEYFNPLDMTLPQSQLQFTWNQDTGSGELWWPRQMWSLDEQTVIPLQPGFTSASLNVAGVTIQGPFWGVDQNEFYVDAKFVLTNPELLISTFFADMASDLNIQTLSGEFSTRLPLDTLCPQVSLELNPIDGLLMGEPFKVDPVQVQYDGHLSWNQSRLLFAGQELVFEGGGLDLDVEPLDSALANFELNFASHCLNREQTDLFIKKQFLSDLLDPEALATFSSNILQTSGRLKVFPDLHIHMDTGFVQVLLFGHQITAENIKIDLTKQGLFLDGTELLFDGKSASLVRSDDGFSFDLPVTVAFLQVFEPYLSGDAEFLLSVNYQNNRGTPVVRGHIGQTYGSLIYPEPWVEMTDLNLDFFYEYGLDLSIQNGTTSVNEGAILFSGTLPATENESHFRVHVDRVPMTIMSSPALISADLDLHSWGDIYNLDGNITIHDLLMSPALTAKEALAFFEESYPAIHFPDPIEENFKLNLTIHSEKNIVFDHELAFLDMNLARLKIKGTLAEPLFYEGSIFINEGSEVKAGRDSYVFNPSQIEFFPNRQGDPYLQISMEMGDYYSNRSIHLIGFLSELENNVGAGDAAAFVGSFLLGKMSNMLSLQGSTGSETLTDASFSLVVAQSLGQKIVTRYILPLDQKNQKNRYELSFGPYNNTMLNLVQEEDDLTYDALRKFKWGRPPGKYQRLKKMKWSFSKQIDWKLKRKIKYRWSIPKTGYYSQLRTRSAQLGLERLLREEGFLDVVCHTKYKDRTLYINVKSGKRYRLTTNRIELTRKEKSELFRKIPLERRKTSDILKLDLRRMVVNKGFFPGLYDLEWRDHELYIDFYPGTQIQGNGVSLGDSANAHFQEMLNDEKWREAFMKTYLYSFDTAMGQLNDLLAAKGFLNPKIAHPRFSYDFKELIIPVELGPQAKLNQIACSINGEEKELEELPWLERYQGQPFDYTLTDKLLKTAHRRLGTDYTVKVKPKKEGENAGLRLQIHTLNKPVYQEVDVIGNLRISKKSILSLLNLPAEIKEENLAEATKTLIEAGQYQSVRFYTDREKATFYLKERNRWDMDFGLSWNEQDETRMRLQFKDRMFLKGHHDYLVKTEWTRNERQAAAQILFRNLWNLKGDLYFYSKWNRTFNAPAVEDAAGFGIIEYQTTLPEYFKQTLEYRYPLSRTHRLQLGTVIFLQRFYIHVEEYEADFFDGSTGELLDTYTLVNDQKLMPIELSWVWKNLDHSFLPQNGNLLTLNCSYYVKGFTDDDWVGPRFNFSHTHFRTWDRLTWQHRLKLGAYQPKGDINYSLSDESPFFFLGGSSNLRGFQLNTVGPYNEMTGKGRGGEAMLFSSQELSYDLSWNGLGLAVFVDTGQVWEKVEEVELGELYYSAGLGLFVDSPIGYFRLDWADRLKHDGRAETKSQWHFLFGKVF